MEYQIINGKNKEVLDTFTPNSIDCCITDPPYELGFMGKKWDSTGIAYDIELWKKLYKALKPGAYLLAFGGTRTFHRIACAIEDAGFEIRDTIMWLYGSGFPKSMNIGLALDRKMGVESEIVGTIYKPNSPHPEGHETSFNDGVKYHDGICVIKKSHNEWSGWGTSLKPAYEPIIVARKPVEKSTIDNVIKYGVGAINIDECRVEYQGDIPQGSGLGRNPNNAMTDYGKMPNLKEKWKADDKGRFPANVIHDGSEEVVKNMPNTKSVKSDYNLEKINQNNPSHILTNIKSGKHFGDEGSVSRYFYCAKASREDRDEGLDNFIIKTPMEQTDRKEGSLGIGYTDENGKVHQNAFAGTASPKRNFHPTVKPTSLMRYLVRLVAPKNATILDIFNGSGSTGKAVALENNSRNMNYKYIGIEMNSEYCEISKARINFALQKKDEK